MNEMIYGNTGKRDEGINIDMDAALYTKLQSRPYVPKLKSLLSDTLQEGDKSFVYIGELTDKSGRFTIYGYNAKLENDSRGGDFGHYIAVALDGPVAAVDFESARFMTEEGFGEYVNTGSISDSNRFSLTPSGCESTENARKKLVNNIMEMFMRAKKSKNVTFSFDRTTVEEFSAKSTGFMLELMKYLPYCMRKNIAFLSHITSKQKLSDLINLAAYDSACEFKPHDCISLNDATPLSSDCAFAGYVEKVFSMDDFQREEYFRRIHNEIELPAIRAGADIKSDLYLLDVSTKDFWATGEFNEVIVNILSCVEDVLKVYPQYLEIAKTRLSANIDEVRDYLCRVIGSCENAEQLKPVYLNIMSFLAVTGIEAGGQVADAVSSKSAEYMEAVSTPEEFINVADSLMVLSPDCINKDAAREVICRFFARKGSLADLFAYYLILKGKNYIDSYELDICLNGGTEILVEKRTSEFSASREKHQQLKLMYREFKDKYADVDTKLVDEVCIRYNEKFKSGASTEAASRGNEVLYNIDRNSTQYSSIYDNKEFIRLLAGLDVASNPDVHNKATDVYRKVSRNFFDILISGSYRYDDVVRLIEEITPAVRKLTANGIYDKEPQNSWGDEKVISDGLQRFTDLFELLIDEMRGVNDSLTNALRVYVSVKNRIENDEYYISKIFDNLAPLVLRHWMRKHPSMATESNLKKAEKQFRKLYDTKLPYNTRVLAADLIKQVQAETGSGSKAKIIIIAVVAVVLVTVLALGGIGAYVFIKDDEPKPITIDSSAGSDSVTDNELYQQAYNAVKNYLARKNNAKLIVGSLMPVEAGKLYEITVTEPLDSDISQDVFTAEISSDGISKLSAEKLGENPVVPAKQYALTIGNIDGKYVIYDIFTLNESEIEADSVFNKNIIMYIEYVRQEKEEEVAQSDSIASDSETQSDSNEVAKMEQPIKETEKHENNSGYEGDGENGIKKSVSENSVIQPGQSTAGESVAKEVTTPENNTHNSNGISEEAAGGSDANAEG